MAALNAQTVTMQDEMALVPTINTTPLVDVMLVLLIIFLITIPVIVKTVPLTLPNARNIATVTKPENIVISVDRNENIYWNNTPVEYAELSRRFEAAFRRWGWRPAAKGGCFESWLRCPTRTVCCAQG